MTQDNGMDLPTPYRATTQRGREWEEFAQRVAEHIDLYTVPQYGDAPHDQVAEWAPELCIESIARYTRRYGRGMRGPHEQERDMFKIAHYAQLVWSKLGGG